MHPVGKKYMEIEQIKEGYINRIVEKSFGLFSSLCENRNFISKSYIHKYLN